MECSETQYVEDIPLSSPTQDKFNHPTTPLSPSPPRPSVLHLPLRKRHRWLRHRVHSDAVDTNKPSTSPPRLGNPRLDLDIPFVWKPLKHKKQQQRPSSPYRRPWTPDPFQPFRSEGIAVPGEPRLQLDVVPTSDDEEVEVKMCTHAHNCDELSTELKLMERKYRELAHELELERTWAKILEARIKENGLLEPGQSPTRRIPKLN
ncbi:hypothetical protein BKA70DRAFT_1224086 [Coprinopsis sp. MPI-PUGE-AT-0042]|nr:hypothetical protein BKA70DRAFT_1224086 [Coprinopsis sp. MPI-PUGE-AT-0042]